MSVFSRLTARMRPAFLVKRIGMLPVAYISAAGVAYATEANVPYVMES